MSAVRAAKVDMRPLVIVESEAASFVIVDAEKTKILALSLYRARARVARSRGMRANLLVKEHKIYLSFLVIS